MLFTGASPQVFWHVIPKTVTLSLVQAAASEEIMTTRRAFIVSGLLTAASLSAVSMLTAAAATARQAPVFSGIVKGVAVGGYDPVSYFSEGKPAPGKPTITLEHLGATWRFATVANRAAFIADPARYAPQYGGYCAWAVSQGYTAKGDPLAWTVTGGKLYLNYNQSVKRGFDKNLAGNIAKADANWPKVLEK